MPPSELLPDAGPHTVFPIDHVDEAALALVRPQKVSMACGRTESLITCSAVGSLTSVIVARSLVLLHLETGFLFLRPLYAPRTTPPARRMGATRVAHTSIHRGWLHS